jgi:hypothetical protein
VGFLLIKNKEEGCIMHYAKTYIEKKKKTNNKAYERKYT